MRKVMRRSAGRARLRASKTRWSSTAQSTASVALGNSARRLSPGESTTRPRCWRTSAAWALGKIGDERAVPGLLRALRDEEAGVSGAAAWALGQIGDESTVPELLKALRDEETGVRSAAARALGWIGDECAMPELLKALHDAGLYPRDYHGDRSQGQSFLSGSGIPTRHQGLEPGDERPESAATRNLSQLELRDQTTRCIPMNSVVNVRTCFWTGS